MNKLYERIIAAAVITIAGTNTAHSAQDIAIAKFTLAQPSMPRIGSCNAIQLTIVNRGNEPSQAIKGGRKNALRQLNSTGIVVYETNRGFRQHYKKFLYIKPLKPGQSQTMNISRVNLPAGNYQVAVAVDPQVAQDPVQNHDIRRINGSASVPCGATSEGENAAGCDIALSYILPATNNAQVNRNQPFTIQARVKNVGSGACAKNGMKLLAYNGSTASGYGRQVGGSASIRQIPALQPNQQVFVEWDDQLSGSGAVTYKLKFSSTHNDANGHNHAKITRSVLIQ